MASLKPRCADPSWKLCDNNGYFCCPSQSSCFGTSQNSDGCADPDYQLSDGEFALLTISQALDFDAGQALPTGSPIAMQL